MYTYTYTHIHTNTYTHTYTHTHIHTQRPPLGVSPQGCRSQSGTTAQEQQWDTYTNITYCVAFAWHGHVINYKTIVSIYNLFQLYFYFSVLSFYNLILSFYRILLSWFRVFKNFFFSSIQNLIFYEFMTQSSFLFAVIWLLFIDFLFITIFICHVQPLTWLME